MKKKKRKVKQKMRKTKQGLVHEKMIRPHLVLEFEEFIFLAWRES